MVDERVFGVNAVIWDGQASSAQTISMVQAAGIRTIRMPGGSLSDDYHWRVNTSDANTWTWATSFNGFINLITSANTQAVVTELRLRHPGKKRLVSLRMSMPASDLALISEEQTIPAAIRN